MPRRDGFPQAQFDSNFAADPKHQRLARRLSVTGSSPSPGDYLPDIYALAGVGLWSQAIAYAWANDDPDVTDAVGGYPAVLVEALVAAGLLAVDGDRVLIPAASFAKWTEGARRARNSARDRAARARQSRGSSENFGEVQRGAREEVDIEVEVAPSSETSSPPRVRDVARAREEVNDGQGRSTTVSAWTTDSQHREGLPNIDAEVAAALERVTGLTVLTGGKWLTRVDQFVERRGKSATLTLLERIPARTSWRSLVFALEDAEAVPKVGEIVEMKPRRTVTDDDLRGIEDLTSKYGLGRVSVSARTVAAVVSPDERDRFREAIVRDLTRRGVRPLSETEVDDVALRTTG